MDHEEHIQDLSFLFYHNLAGFLFPFQLCLL